MEYKKTDIRIPGRLVTTAYNNQVVDTEQVWDSELKKSQQEINKDIAIRVLIFSTGGVVIKNGQGSCTLYAQVYKGNDNITSDISDNKYSWTRISTDNAADLIWNQAHEGCGPQITVTGDDVSGLAMFECNVNYTN